MTLPRVKIECAFSSNPGDQSPLWVDITSDVQGRLTMTRGRSDEFASVEPGRLSLQLDNAAGDYTWGKTGSRFYPGVLPGRRIRYLLTTTALDEVLPPPVPEPDPEPTTVPEHTQNAGADLGPTFTVPGGSIYFATTGNDTTGTGAEGAPYATLAKAVSVAVDGDTIVARGGTYEMGGAYPGRPSPCLAVQVPNLTIMNYPGETVWLDGTTVQTGWSLSAGTWQKAIVQTADRSPTYSRGALDGTSAGWQWVNPAYPCAPWPEQVFIDGVPQTQVSTLAAVTAGTFYVAGTASGTNNFTWTSSVYHLGTDPTGKEVRVGVTARTNCMALLETGITLKGIGIRRYSNSVPDWGVLVCNRSNITLEHVTIEDAAATGVSLYTAHNFTANNLTVTRAGLVGGSVDKSDDVTLDRCAFTYNTAGRFNSAPVSGGWKHTHAQRFTVTRSLFNDNYQHGLWHDECVLDPVVVNSEMRRNGGYGLIHEIGASPIAANCVITNNTRGNILHQGTDLGRYWNNTLDQPGKSCIEVVQDPRRPQNGSFIDSRFPASSDYYLTDMTWVITSFQFKNNAVTRPASTGYALSIVSQENPYEGWANFGPDLGGNLYNRVSASVPVNEFLIARDGLSAAGYTTFAAYKAVVAPQDATSVAVDGLLAIDASTLMLTAASAAAVSPVALPSDIAALVGVPAGTQHTGAWR